jgi:ornithine cyclodeaminase/alanine dehydrogenase-like protein (mu-crystallin family)
MKVLVVSEAEVRELLPMADCMDAMAEALAALSRGDVLMPLRSIVWLPDRVGGLATMPAAMPTSGAMGLKAISVFPGNLGTHLDSHQGVVLLFETEQGQLQAIMDATSITAIRTAAVSGVATKLLARQDAGDLAILGSGTQAWTHLEAMLLARPLTRVRVWSRSVENGRRLADRAASRFGIKIEVVGTAREAVLGADLVCTVTSSLAPVLEGSWLSTGAHVNAVGAVGPTVRELDTEAVARSRLFVDRRESALNEAGEFVLARAEGAIGDDHIVGEIGEILLGNVTGRASPEDVTVFRSLGVAVEDLASARLVYRRAVESGAGTWVELGGGREA